MAHHELKIWPDWYEAVQSGLKSFELRKNDRKFSVGDTITFREWIPQTGTYTDKEFNKVIVYMIDGIGPGAIVPFIGLLRGYCILGLK